MAGAGYKLFNTGDVLTAAQVNTYLQEQVVMVFASAAARTTALSGVLAEGMVSYLKDTNATEVYDGSAWVGIGNSGDITEVQAGTGISVASGTGPIPVVTNTVATAFDAKGDLIGGTGADTFSRLAVGTNGQVLTADSTTATGLKWATASSTPSFKGVYTYIASDSTLSNNTSTAVTYDTELFDTDGFHSTTTNKDRITIPAGLGGYYLVIYGAQWNGSTTGYRQTTILKNNTSNVLIHDYPGFTTGNNYIGKSTIVSLAAGDYINVSAYQNSGGSLALGGGAVATFFSVQYLGA
jgi:hypothetical protein